MVDYWKKLKLDECWSNKQRFNIIMEKIENTVVGDSDIVEVFNNIKEKVDNLVIPSKTSELENDSGFITEHQSLEGYVEKQDTDGLLRNDGSVDESDYLTEHQDISGKIDRNELFKNGVFTTTNTNSRGSIAKIWNESDGGGTQFTDNSSNVVSFVGVNEGSRDGDIYVQIYSKNKSNNSGVRLNFNPNGAFYTVGTTKTWTNDDEIATVGALRELEERISLLEDRLEQMIVMIDYWSKLKLDECWSEKQRFNRIMNHILNEEGPEGSVTPMIEDDEEI